MGATAALIKSGGIAEKKHQRHHGSISGKRRIDARGIAASWRNRRRSVYRAAYKRHPRERKRKTSAAARMRGGIAAPQQAAYRMAHTAAIA